MRNGQTSLKTGRGFARDEAAERRLKAQGVKIIYRADQGETLDKVHMRKGEYLNVVDGYKGLADRREEMVKAYQRIHKAGATVRDAETGLESREDGGEMMRIALAPKIDKAKQAAFQKLSVEQRTNDGRMEKERARRIWHDQRYTLDEFEAMTGWPRSTAYLAENFGNRFKRKMRV